MSSTESEGQTQDSENPHKNPEQDYELLPETYPKYDLSFKIIVIGNSGKKIFINNYIYNYRSRKILLIDSSNEAQF